jgi:hypothetical protein
MLHCNMSTASSPPLQLQLEDVLAGLQYARRTDDLGRLALITYCDVRRWARRTQRDALAERASDVMTRLPHPSRSEFLAIVDDVISELERIHVGIH